MRLAPFLFIAACSVMHADKWPAPPPSRAAVAIDGSAKVVESASGERLQRSMKVYTRPGTASEALYWQADLVNCPVQIFVAPGGHSVVTMDTWGSLGLDALVFYGPRGTVLKRYRSAQQELVTPNEASKIPKSVSSFRWSEGAHAEFTADGAYFWVWLPSGRVMFFDARTGNAVDAQALRVDPKNGGRTTVLRTCEILAASATPKQRIAAARLAGWMNGRSVLPLLRKLLSDPYYEDTGEETKAEDPWGRFRDSPMFLYRRVYPVRRAAAEEMHIAFGHTETAVEEQIAR